MAEDTASHLEDNSEESPTPADVASTQPEPDSPARRFALAEGRRPVRRILGGRIFILANTLTVVIVVVLVFGILARREHGSFPKAVVASGRPIHADDRSSKDSSALRDGRLQETPGASWRTARAAFAKKDYAGA